MNTLLVGAGYWGKNFIRVLNDPSNCFDLKYILDTQNKIEEYECFKDFESLKKVIKKIDCAVVCSPTKTHYTVVKELLKHKINVLVEKPITTNTEEAIELYELAKANGVVLLTDHTFLYNSSINYIYDFVQSGELGDLVHISFERTNLGPIRTDVSSLWDLTTHDISILNAFVNEDLIKINASGFSLKNNDIFDMVNISLNYKNIFISIFSSWLHPEKSRKIKFVGTKKMLVFDDTNVLEPIKIYNKKFNDITETSDNYNSIFNFSIGDVVSPYVKQVEPLKKVILDFENRIYKKERINILNSEKLTIDTIDILQKIDKLINSN